MAIFSKIIESLILKITKRGVLIPLLVILLFSCNNSQPLKDYSIKRLNLNSGLIKGDELLFNLEFDTTATQEIYICAIIKNNSITNNTREIPLDIKVISPSNLERTFSVSLPINVIKKRGTYRKSSGTIEIEWSLLKSIKECESGIYNIIISQNSNLLIYKNILAIGIRSANNE